MFISYRYLHHIILNINAFTSGKQYINFFFDCKDSYILKKLFSQIKKKYLSQNFNSFERVIQPQESGVTIFRNPGCLIKNAQATKKIPHCIIKMPGGINFHTVLTKHIQFQFFKNRLLSSTKLHKYRIGSFFPICSGHNQIGTNNIFFSNTCNKYSKSHFFLCATQTTCSIQSARNCFYQ